MKPEANTEPAQEKRTVKIAILGGGGVRTPLILQAIRSRHSELGVSDVALMDIDRGNLDRVQAVFHALIHKEPLPFDLNTHTEGSPALQDADFVITTFRVGNMEARILDETIPLAHGVLGQETTGPGGLAMALRSIPVLLKYIETMRTHCPGAWLINFANPSGLLAQAARDLGGWSRTIGICDAPHGMQRVAAEILRAPIDEVEIDYFGLNHLGWIRRIVVRGHDHLPRFLRTFSESGSIPGLPFTPELLESLGLIPNEYLYYYYSSRRAVANLRAAQVTRGQLLAEMNRSLHRALDACIRTDDDAGIRSTYYDYLHSRGSTYMATETDRHHPAAGLEPAWIDSLATEGYAGVALNVIAALTEGTPRRAIVNLPNSGAIEGMSSSDVVEVTAEISSQGATPLPVGPIPDHCLGLMKQVKAVERLMIEAAWTASLPKASAALALHPLVADETLARVILDEYRKAHRAYFPDLA
jgi:6-phospho-beta-glucosidase